MKITKKVKENAIEIVKSIILIGSIAGFMKYKGCGIEKRRKFAIGTTCGKYWTLKSGEGVRYYFTVKDSIFKGGNDSRVDMVKIDGQYLVKFDSLDPSWNKIYFNVPIPDSLISKLEGNCVILPPYLDSLYKVKK